METLNKQIWINQLQRNFYADTSFMNPIPNKSGLVNNDKVNLQEAGVDPSVLINNTSYPIAVSDREDTPIEIPLDKFETENTLVRRPEVIEYSYDQLEDVLKGHRDTLRVTTAERAAHAIAPQEDSANTPIVTTTGGDNGDGLKRLLPVDIFKLKRRFDDLDIPFEMRYLVLHPKHVEDLMIYDLDIFKDITDMVNGKPKNFAGFNIMQFTKNPIYDRTTLQKVAYGAVNPNETHCSFAFYSPEIFRADGGIYMYSRVNDPEERATIVGFDKRFICMPIRNKAIGSIVAVAA